MTLVLGVLVFIILFYFIIAFSPLKICAICTAVSLTWLGLLAGFLLGWHDNLLLLAILMGSSVVGLMYKAEKMFQKKKLTNFWLVRLLIIILGYLAVYLLLTSAWSNLLLLAIVSILLGFFSLFFIKKELAQEINLSKAKKYLKDKLDHCCD